VEGRTRRQPPGDDVCVGELSTGNHNDNGYSIRTWEQSEMGRTCRHVTIPQGQVYDSACIIALRRRYLASGEAPSSLLSFERELQNVVGVYAFTKTAV
jgi:hypothetical protein